MPVLTTQNYYLTTSYIVLRKERFFEIDKNDVRILFVLVKTHTSSKACF